ncbi:CRISPR-associated endoribonuclease [Sulfolobales archaeon HS-7]|nr:CRISPR-associated endoribonuclease [Sulfolobales archaeon HS-7]
MIYRHLPPKTRKSLHENGVRQGPRKFKLFTFSRLYGDFVRRDNSLIFRDFAYLCISSVLTREMRLLINSLSKESSIRIGKCVLNVDSMRVLEFPDNEEREFYTLSPIVVTKRTNETKYLLPFDDEYNMRLSLNLKRKVKAVTGREPMSEIKFRFLKWRRVITLYKGNPVIGVMGKFKLYSTKTELKVGYFAGLGVKNSQGFGMFEFEGISVRDLLG